MNFYTDSVELTQQEMNSLGAYQKQVQCSEIGLGGEICPRQRILWLQKLTQNSKPKGLLGLFAIMPEYHPALSASIHRDIERVVGVASTVLAYEIEVALGIAHSGETIPQEQPSSPL